jgi:hypothetical protein
MKKLEDIWNRIKEDETIFTCDQVKSLPVGVQRYLKHAIQNKSRKTTAVLLKMHGTIKVNKWFDFTAEQIIVRNKGFVWQASVSIGGINIRGHDLLFDDRAIMRWKLMNLIPIVNESNPDIYKSAIGRYAIEAMWLPTVFLNEVCWKQKEEKTIIASYDAFGEPINLEMSIDDNGSLKSISMNRWGNFFDKKNYSYIPFGGNVLEEKDFNGFIIPSKINAGWMYGTEQYDEKGEFFRVEIDDAKFK